LSELIERVGLTRKVYCRNTWCNNWTTEPTAQCY